MEESNISLKETGDGSHTLYRADLNETYHSHHGAFTESAHVFIQSGLSYWAENNSGSPIRILEIGMGTGLNVVLTLQKSIEWQREIHYTALEPYPVPPAMLSQLNYETLLPRDIAGLLSEIHQAEWGKDVELSPKFILKKLNTRLEDFASSSNAYDVIYFDAFAPSKQPELWGEGAVVILAENCMGGTMLVTYSSQGKFRRLLEKFGFEVHKIPGPPGKREMIRAFKR